MRTKKQQTKFVRLLAERNMTVPELAKLTGSDKVTAWRHVTGESKMFVDDAILYARVLGVSVADLVG